jgi:hypothetical protein
MEKTVKRLQAYLTLYGRKYPLAWKQFDEFRAMRGSSNAFEWADWCFCPLAGAYAIVSGGGDLPLSRAPDVGILGALAAWRATQGIYRFDPSVFEAVWATPVSGEIPTEIIYHLPEWCCYIETPGKAFGGVKMHGLFVHLDDDRQNLRDELRFVFDTERGLIPYPLHLQKTGLEESLRSVAREATFQAEKAGQSFTQRFAVEAELKRQIEPVLSLTLYLCSQSAEIPDYENRPQPQYNPRQKRLYPAARPRVWEVAYRLGAAIRKAEAQEAGTAAESEDAPSNRQSPRPHIRRAHWHGFWTGPRKGEQKFVLKWLPPIAVNVEPDAPAVPTIKEVE